MFLVEVLRGAGESFREIGVYSAKGVANVVTGFVYGVVQGWELFWEIAVKVASRLWVLLSSGHLQKQRP